MSRGTSGGDTPGGSVAPALVGSGLTAGGPVAYLDRLVTLIGSKPNCHLRIESPRVSGTHALFLTAGGRTYVRDLVSRTGVFVRGRRVQEAFLKDGDPVRIGDAEFEFRLVNSRPPGEGRPEQRVDAVEPAKRAAAMELLVEGFDDAPPVPVEGPVFLIGRREGAEVILEDSRVSSAHAAVIEALGRWHLYDLNSKFGTFHNGARAPNAVLSDGDLIQISEFRIRCRAAAGGVAPPVEPVATPVEAAALPVEPRALPVEPGATPVAPRVAQVAASAPRAVPPPPQATPPANPAAAREAVPAPKVAPSAGQAAKSKDAPAPVRPRRKPPRPATAAAAVPAPARDLPTIAGPPPMIEAQPPPVADATAVGSADAPPLGTGTVEPASGEVATLHADPAAMPSMPASPASAAPEARPIRRGSAAPHFRVLQCKRCGYYVRPTTLFCPACGKWRRLAYALLAGALLLLVLLGVLAALWLPRLRV